MMMMMMMMMITVALTKHWNIFKLQVLKNSDLDRIPSSGH
jgi:hypothetical protein